MSVYRIGMAIDKSQYRDWSLAIHEGKHVGAALLAARTQASLEAEQHEGKHNLLALPDCSKCYETVHHALAGDRARRPGCRRGQRIWYSTRTKRGRHVKANGAVAWRRSGKHACGRVCFRKGHGRRWRHRPQRRPMLRGGERMRSNGRRSGGWTAAGMRRSWGSSSRDSQPGGAWDAAHTCRTASVHRPELTCVVPTTLAACSLRCSEHRNWAHYIHS